MRRLSNFTAIWLSVMTLAAAVLSHMLIGQEPTKFAVDLAVLFVAAYHGVNYFMPAVRALRRGGQSGADRLNIGLWLVWMAYFLQRDWVIGMAYFRRPQWMVESVGSTIIATLIFLAGMYVAFAPVSDNVELPRREIVLMVLSASFASVVIGIVIGVYIIGGVGPG